PEQKMTRAAGGVDEARVLEAEDGNGWFEGAVEDELLDELRGLQEGIALASVLREFLVQVPQEAGVPRRVREIVHQLPGFRDHPAPEGYQLFGRVPGDAIVPDGVVLGVEQRGDRRQALRGAKDVIEIIAVAVRGTLLKVLHLPVRCQAAALLRSGQQ